MNWDALDIWWTSNVTRKPCSCSSWVRWILHLALVGFSSFLVADLGDNAPITQTSFTYFALALVYGSILLDRRQRPRGAWCWYLLLGFINAQGNYLGNEAFQSSSLTSVTLLDCWAIAWAIFLTYIFIGTRYSLWQLSGMALCALGVGLVLLSDAGILAFVGFAMSSFMSYFITPFVLRLSGATMFNLSVLHLICGQLSFASFSTNRLTGYVILLLCL